MRGIRSSDCTTLGRKLATLSRRREGTSPLALFGNRYELNSGIGRPPSVMIG
jgi:hypothetical protein